ncbi:MAG: hypothetical protein IK016_05550 [Lachnospiraceae bacterium]|nr:hypothetical protein [Lachnospiraceae bacterium]
MDRHEEQTWLQRVTGSLPGLSLSERQLRHRRRGRFIFTDKKHPWRGIFSVVISVMSFSAVILAVVLTVRGTGGASASAAAGILLALIYAIAGLILGILSRLEREVYLLFPRLGIFLNAAAIVCIGGILFLGFRA